MVCLMIQFFCIMKEWYNYFQWACRALFGERKSVSRAPDAHAIVHHVHAPRPFGCFLSRFCRGHKVG